MDKSPVSVLKTLESPKHSTKKELRAFSSTPKRGPPKLNSKKNLNRRLFTSQLITLLKPNDENSYVSRFYDESLSISYFDQCFEVISKIGEGSFGEVYKVRCRDDGKLYAIKKTKDMYRGKSDRKQKVEEVTRYESIPKHENIVRLFNAWEQDDFVYLQMELGKTSLERFAQQNPIIAEDKLWNILVDMLLALQNIHDCNMIHLDVKLENIIMCENEVCKLGDFGLLTDLKSDFRNLSEGDAKYLASEVMSGKYTKAADIFSLGISMLELAADLELPVYGKLWHDLRNEIFPTDIIKVVPKELMNIIRRMMAKDYKKRPSVKSLMKHPRIKSLLKQRREAASSRIESRFSPSVFRTSTPLPCTPPNSMEPPNINVTEATPPIGYSTANLTFLLTSLENSINANEDSLHNHSEVLFENTPQKSSKKSFRHLPLTSSAKKLNFFCDDD